MELTIPACMANLCNLDGVIVPEARAHVPVLDRGFLFGDSIYEVVRTAGAVPFAWPEHFARLRESAAGLLMELDVDEREIAGRVRDTLAAAELTEAYVRIIVTRGTATAPNIGLATATGPLTWVVMVRELPAGRGLPARLHIVDRLRNDRRALDPATKSGNYLNSVLGLAEAQAAGATDCLMANAQGFVTEASTANLFAFLDGQWCTPPLADGLLAGVTRRLVLDCLAQSGEPAAERQLTPADVRRAEDLCLTSTLRDVAAVTHLDGDAIHGGEPGAAAQALAARFEAYAAERFEQRYTPAWRELVG